MSCICKTGIMFTQTFYESGANFIALFEENGAYLTEESGTIIVDEATTSDMATTSSEAMVLSGQAMSMSDTYILAREFIEY